MTTSFDDFQPKSNATLTKDETDIFNEIFESNYQSNNSKSQSHSGNHKNHKPFYDCSYNTIIFAIIITILFIIFAAPTTAMWFSCYIPDPYFNLITRALIFFILVFLFDLALCYYSCRNHDDK